MISCRGAAVTLRVAVALCPRPLPRWAKCSSWLQAPQIPAAKVPCDQVWVPRSYLGQQVPLMRFADHLKKVVDQWAADLCQRQPLLGSNQL